MVNVEIKDLNDNGLDGYYCSMDVLMVLQFGGGWNLSGTLPQNGILAPLVDLLASPQVKMNEPQEFRLPLESLVFASYSSSPSYEIVSIRVNQ